MTTRAVSYSEKNRPVVRRPGHDVDRVDVEAGLSELKKIGVFTAETTMVIEYALVRWARGEEDAAQRGATDESFHGVQFVTWLRVLAAARASAEAAVRT